MKKSTKAVIGSLGALGVGVGAALGIKKFTEMDLVERCNKCSKGFCKAIESLQKGLPDPPVDDISENDNAFSQGNGKYLDAPAKKACWSLGYSALSILPDDISTKKYCIAGVTKLPANYSDGVLDKIMVRTIALDDGSGRGTCVFAVVDCIGLSNKNIREIRNRLKDFSSENNVVSVNISSTHTHSSIDTMGIWGPILEVFKNNKKVLKTGKGELMNSCDLGYMEFLYEKITESIKLAVADKCKGKLYESYMGKSSAEGLSREDSLKDRGLLGYVWDRREPKDCSTQLLRLRFVPKDKNKKQTVILNFGAHPYINSMTDGGKGTGDMISGDFVSSLSDFIEKNNSNFIFFNGAVAAVYPTRLYSRDLDYKHQAIAVGEEIGRIALAMTETNENIYKNQLLSPEIYENQLGLFDGQNSKSNYTKWVENKGEQVIKETELPPLMNLQIKKVDLQVDNPIFYAIAKLRVGLYTVLPGENGKYTSFTEVGLLELGGKRKIALIPGELEPAVLSGSEAVKAKESFSKTEFSAPVLKDSAEDEELTVFGLTNDAIGYIIPDNDFSMMFLGSGEKMKKLFGNHYLEIFSFGKNTAVSVADGFNDIIKEIKDGIR